MLGAAVSAQTPQSFRYQAVARDNSGNILANQSVSFRINILIGNVSGTVAYSETHTGLSTNAFGLIELEIGKGTPVTGTFSAIEWGNNSYFVKIEMDPAGGSAYQVLSTSQLLSVPYALHANTVQTGDNWGEDNVNTDATLTGNGTVASPLQIAGNGVNSSKILYGSIVSADLANAAVTGAKISQAGAASGQALKWSGTTRVPADDAIALPYSGTGTSDGPIFNIVNLGTSGAISTLSSGNYGIWGESASTSGIGVYGVNKTSTGTTYGVFGDVYSSSGFSGFFQDGKFYIKPLVKKRK